MALVLAPVDLSASAGSEAVEVMYYVPGSEQYALALVSPRKLRALPASADSAADLEAIEGLLALDASHLASEE